MTRPTLLDLYCGAGGAGMGYHRAGFDVWGVDIAPQKHYPFGFTQMDALEYLDKYGDRFDAIHASPPCQAFSDMRTMWNARRHDDLLTPTRALLQRLGVPYVIENVQGAPMPTAIVLCGSMFGLGVDDYQLRRHRYFEISTGLMLAPACAHRGPVIGIYGDHARNRGRRNVRDDRGTQFPNGDMVRLARAAMGIDWMNWREISQAIPPAYTFWIGQQLQEALRMRAEQEGGR